MSRLFVTGATGVLGRRVLPLLVAAGHDVSAVARSDEKAHQVRAAGARPVRVDLFDAHAVEQAVAGHDVTLNLATHIPSTAKAALPGAWRENERIRRELSRNLVDAALATGAERIVQEALAFIYVERDDDGWLHEDDPVDGGSFNVGVHVAEEQAARFTAAGGAGVVLRFGLFHAWDSEQTQQAMALARRGMAMTVGSPDGYLSIIDADDAARAVVAALDAPAGVYNVVDDEPLTRRAYAEALGAALGRSKPLRLPPAVASRLGGSKTSLLARSQRVSNARLRAATGWSPASPSARETWRKVVAEAGARS